MRPIKFSYENAKPFINEEKLDGFFEKAMSSMEVLNSKSGAGNDYLGWLNLPNDYDKSEFNKILKVAEKIKKNSEVLVVIGIGGSYLGAKSGIDFLKGTFYNYKEKDTPNILFAGNSLSASYHYELFELLKDKDFSINVISKSGTTTEPKIAFELLSNLLKSKYSAEEVKQRIIVTTDKAKGEMFQLAKAEGYQMFVIPDDIGGRYSVLTAVGLIPLAVAGADIKMLMDGAAQAMNDFSKVDPENDVLQYAALRNYFYQEQKSIEILVNYEPDLQYLGEWFKQLFGESEGKDNKGLFPASLNFTTDLHSMGQYVQQGTRNIFQTVLAVNTPKFDIDCEFGNAKTMDEVNKTACQGTLMAHIDGGVPNLLIEIEKMDEYNLGYLYYFFEKVCGVSAYLLGVNPFDQPGVEEYKKNMFRLLGKG